MDVKSGVRAASRRSFERSGLMGFSQAFAQQGLSWHEESLV